MTNEDLQKYTLRQNLISIHSISRACTVAIYVGHHQCMSLLRFVTRFEPLPMKVSQFMGDHAVRLLVAIVADPSMGGNIL